MTSENETGTAERNRQIKRRIVERLLVSGMFIDEIFVAAKIKENGRDVKAFRNIEELQRVIDKIKESWAVEYKDIVRERVVSLNRTISLIDMQVARLNKMIRKEGEEDTEGESETKRINIEKRITELALARHSLIDGAATAKLREAAGHVPR